MSDERQRTGSAAVRDAARSPAAGRRRITRRHALRTAAVALTAGSLVRIEPALARRLLVAVRAQGPSDDAYQPSLFNAREWPTLIRLCELIVPADEHSGSAVDAGAPELIDLLATHNPELARIFTSGMLWLDREMRRRGAPSFGEAAPQQQTAVLDELAAASIEPPEPGYQSYEPSDDYAGFQAYTVNADSPVAAGVPFFQWTRRLVVDAFYASPEGVRDLDYRGNASATEYTVPEDIIRYALDRSPFRS